MTLKEIIFVLSILTAQSLYAQPGDKQYSLVLYDYNNWGFIDCTATQNTYQVLACKVEYLSNDFLQTSWTPDFETLKVTDTLICRNNTDTMFPFKTFYIGMSYLNTTMLLIIKNQKDTMYIDGAGEHLVSDYYGTQNGLPAVIPFSKDMIKLFELQNEVDYRRLQNSTYHKFWTTSTLNIPVYNPWVKRISELTLNKEKYYHQNDTLILEITGKITSDGGCDDGNVLWVLQKQEGDNWVSIKENLIQMDCGRGRNTFDQKQLPLFIITNKINPEMYSFPKQIELNSGKYRVYIFDDIGLPYFSEIFEI